MYAKDALREVNDALNDWASFLETFEPEDRRGSDGVDRLFAYREEHALKVLGDLIAAANAIIDDEVDIQSGNVAAGFTYDIAELARSLGRFDELREFEAWQDDES